MVQLAGTLDASVNITNCNVRGNSGHGIVIDSDGGNTSIVNPLSVVTVLTVLELIMVFS